MELGARLEPTFCHLDLSGDQESLPWVCLYEEPRSPLKETSPEEGNLSREETGGALSTVTVIFFVTPQSPRKSSPKMQVEQNEKNCFCLNLHELLGMQGSPLFAVLKGIGGSQIGYHSSILTFSSFQR